MVSVFPDPILELHTTRSWDFLDSDLGMKPLATVPQHSSNDIIIALIDTGVQYLILIFCVFNLFYIKYIDYSTNLKYFF